MEQLIFLAIIALISFVNWLMQRSAELREKKRLERKRSGDSGESPYRTAPAEDAHESRPTPPAADPAADMRRLMEALGLPVEAEPPRPVPAPPPLPAFEEAVPRPEPVPEIPTFTPPPRAVAAKPAPPAPRPPSPLLKTLRTREGLRQAIVLREILGPPKALSN